MTMIYLLGLAVSVGELFYKKTYRRYGLILLVGSILALCIHITAMRKDATQPVTEIHRTEKGEGKQSLELQVAVAEEEEELLRLEIGAQSYDNEELDELETAMWRQLERGILGNNESPDTVTEDLYFPERVEGYPFFLEWSNDAPKLLGRDGALGEEIPKQGVLTEVRVKIRKEQSDFEKERVFYVRLFPPQTKQAFLQRLKQYLEETEQTTREKESYLLPESFEGKRLIFREKGKDNSSAIFFLFLIGAAAVAVAEKEEQKKKEQQRKSEIEREYPQLAVRMAMLSGTGMTISGAFKRIAGEYGRKKQIPKSALYEEMLVACREIESGISEKTAYQNLGKRCGVSCMIRFTALLVQYTGSGAVGLKKALQEEAAAALKERKERARRKGEEASTKLLLPMMLLLVLVMVIIMIPAFSSFGI